MSSGVSGGTISYGGAPISRSYFQHVFDTREEALAEMQNLLQYGVLVTPLILLLNAAIATFIPEADAESSSLALVAEILLQLVLLVLGMLFIHKTVTYLPTYSGYRYDTLNLTSALLPFLILLYSIQSRIGIKLNILQQRLGDLWNGTSAAQKTPKRRVTSPGLVSAGAGMQAAAPVQRAAAAPAEPEYGPMPANTFGSLF